METIEADNRVLISLNQSTIQPMCHHQRHYQLDDRLVTAVWPVIYETIAFFGHQKRLILFWRHAQNGDFSGVKYNSSNRCQSFLMICSALPLH